jgi:hypothetical protein
MRLPCVLAVLSLAGSALAAPAHAQHARNVAVAARSPVHSGPPLAFERGAGPRLAPGNAPTRARSGWRSARRVLLHTGVGALAGGALGAWAGHEMHQRLAYIGPDPNRHRRWVLQLGAGGAAVGGLVGTVVGRAREARADNVVPAAPAAGR